MCNRSFVVVVFVVILLGVCDVILECSRFAHSCSTRLEKINRQQFQKNLCCH